MTIKVGTATIRVGETALVLAAERGYRDRVQADYDALPPHLQAHQMGQDRLACVAMVNRTIARLEELAQERDTV